MSDFPKKTQKRFQTLWTHLSFESSSHQIVFQTQVEMFQNLKFRAKGMRVCQKVDRFLRQIKIRF